MLDGLAADLFFRACRRPLLTVRERQLGQRLDRAAVERVLPHRDPFLFVHEVTRLDPDGGIVVARCAALERHVVLQGHFPAAPTWPGVLQVEAIGQAGLCLVLSQHRRSARPGVPFAFTHVLGARFARPLALHDEVEIVARLVPDGLFTIIVGQCLQGEEVCSAAAVQGMDKELE